MARSLLVPRFVQVQILGEGKNYLADDENLFGDYNYAYYNLTTKRANVTDRRLAC